MSSSSSSANEPVSISNEQERDWLDLPSDVTSNILKRIGVDDILENAQKVCTAWRKVCKDPAMWRIIKVKTLFFFERMICKQAVDRSQGQLVDISIEGSGDDQILSYVADRSTQLRRLEILFFSDYLLGNLSELLMKFPLLEELNLNSTDSTDNDKYMKKEFIETAGRYCPMLKTLKVNRAQCRWLFGVIDNEVAIAIGENLHGLRHLALIGNDMSNIGLQAILDGCLCLETLDLRRCLGIDLSGDMRKRCFKQIKSLKLPYDSVEGTPYRLDL